MKRLLLVDNYDSFTHILAHLFGGAGADVDVVRNDDDRIAFEIPAVYDAIVIGPGPGRPAQAGRTLGIVSEAAQHGRPLFGVCLGLQAIGEAFGGDVVHAPALMHGKTSRSRMMAKVCSPAYPLPLRPRAIIRSVSHTTGFPPYCTPTR